MKQTTLEDLFYGNINPNEISFVRGSEYGKCFDKLTELSKSVCSQLTEEYINKMNELESTYTRILSETDEFRIHKICIKKLNSILLEIYIFCKSIFNDYIEKSLIMILNINCLKYCRLLG